MFKHRKKRELKERKFLKRGRRNHGFCHGFGRCHRNFNLDSDSNTNESSGLQEDLCPLCKNHCSLENPGCPRGEEYLAVKKAA